MDINIRKYISEYEQDIIRIITDDNWSEYTDKIDFYKGILKESVVYCAYSGNTCCGFIRALTDKGIAVYIMDLLVVKSFRNNGIGEMLLKRIKSDYEGLHVYVLSNEDKYYEKKGLEKVGSVFEIVKP
jgi:predicted acetyltransferase